MKILIYSGCEPYINSSTKDLVSNKHDCGGNIGNLLFLNAVAESVNITDDIEFISTYYRADYTDAEIDRINAECEYFILPLADAFREDNIPKLESLTCLIKKLRIPCIVVGVGLRAALHEAVNEKKPFDENVKAFVRAVLEKSECLGLRGERTARYLENMGFKEDRDYRVIGCPSLCMAHVGKGIKIKELDFDSNSRIALNANDLAPENVSNMYRRIVEEYDNSVVVQQRITEIIDIYIDKYSEYGKNLFRIDGSLYGKDIYARLKKDNRLYGPANIYDWIRRLCDFDVCVNTRFHGTVASLMAGVPSIIIPIDSRMAELVEYHNLSKLDLEDITEDFDLKENISRIDLKKPEAVAARNLERYFDFLKKNGLHHVGSEHNLRYTDDSQRWCRGSEPFEALDLVKKTKRIVGYYEARVGNKILRKLANERR